MSNSMAPLHPLIDGLEFKIGFTKRKVLLKGLNTLQALSFLTNLPNMRGGTKSQLGPRVNGYQGVGRRSNCLLNNLK